MYHTSKVEMQLIKSYQNSDTFFVNFEGANKTLKILLSILRRQGFVSRNEYSSLSEAGDFDDSVPSYPPPSYADVVQGG